MGILVRRSLVLAALMFWQGGFTFYAAVVVPIGQEILGSHRKQGFITQPVTNYLNLAGGVALVLLFWDAAVSRERTGRWRRVRWLALAGMGAALVALVWLHLRMDEMLDPEVQEIVYPSAFRRTHKWYLWISTIQWGLGVVFAVLTVWAWRAEDRVV